MYEKKKKKKTAFIKATLILFYNYLHISTNNPRERFFDYMFSKQPSRIKRPSKILDGKILDII